MVGIPLIPVIKEKENTQAIRIIWRGKKEILRLKKVWEAYVSSHTFLYSFGRVYNLYFIGRGQAKQSKAAGGQF